MSKSESRRVAILIVAFRNGRDVKACLAALARSSDEPPFDVFVCENGGIESFQELCDTLLATEGPCSVLESGLSDPFECFPKRLAEVECLALKQRATRVWIGCACKNLGYAGGVNVWIDHLLSSPGYYGFWILNPDTQPEPHALRALVERSVTGKKGIVGSTIVNPGDPSYVHCRAGHRWRKVRTRLGLIGLDESVNTPVNLKAIEASLDCISGASMYMTRACREEIGPMDERFFLFYEDADWSFRAKHHGLGYAPDSVVPHRGGTTIGSTRMRSERSKLTCYLEGRNHLHFVRMHSPRYFPLALLFGCMEAILYLFVGSPGNTIATANGMLAAIKGETGPPKFHS